MRSCILVLCMHLIKCLETIEYKINSVLQSYNKGVIKNVPVQYNDCVCFKQLNLSLSTCNVNLFVTELCYASVLYCRLDYCDEAVRDSSQTVPVDIHQPPAFLHKILQLNSVQLLYETLKEPQVRGA